MIVSPTQGKNLILNIYRQAEGFARCTWILCNGPRPARSARHKHLREWWHVQRLHGEAHQAELRCIEDEVVAIGGLDAILLLVLGGWCPLLKRALLRIRRTFNPPSDANSIITAGELSAGYPLAPILDGTLMDAAVIPSRDGKGLPDPIHIAFAR